MNNKKDKKLSFPDKVQQLLGKMSLNDKMNKMASFLADLNICDTEAENGNVFYLNNLQNSVEAAATFNTELIKENAKSVFENYNPQNNAYGIAAIFNINISSDKNSYGIGGLYSEDSYLTSAISSCLIAAAKEANYGKKSLAGWSVPQYNCSFADCADYLNLKLFRDEYYIMLKGLLKNSKYFIVNYIGSPQKAGAVVKSLSTVLFNELNFKGNVLFKLCKEKNSISDDVLLEIMKSAVNAGCLLICRNAEFFLKEAVKQKAIKEKSVDKLLGRLLSHMQSESNKPSEQSNMTVNNYKEALAEESIILLKNDGLLPLAVESAKKIAVIGPYAAPSGRITEIRTVINGIQGLNQKAETIFAQGCSLDDNADNDDVFLSEAVWAAQQAEIIILTVGCSSTINTNNRLPNNQEKLINEICGIGHPVILLNFSESWVDLSVADEMCNCVLQCWNEYRTGGDTIAKIIFGECNPSGKLPITFYKTDDNQAADSDAVERYVNGINQGGNVLYPFGYGLSYSFAEYYRIYLSEPKIKRGEDITVTIFAKNKGKYSMKETIQAYLKDEQASEPVPKWRLAALKKVSLLPGEEKKVSMKISNEMMSFINSAGKAEIEPGRFSIYVGGGQPDDITADLYNRDCLHIGFLVE